MIDPDLKPPPYIGAYVTRFHKSGMSTTSLGKLQTPEQLMSFRQSYDIAACEEDRDVGPLVIYTQATPTAAAATSGFPVRALPEPTVEPGRVRVKKEKKPKT